MYKNVVVEIVEQPAELNRRFRYQSEGRTRVFGVNSTFDKRTFPAIRVLNYTGTAVVVASCVTKDYPHRPHPNSLVGKNCCKGVCRIDFQTNELAPTVVEFEDIGIHCCTKYNIRKVLMEREKLRIDPFKTGYEHKFDKSFDTSVRLCFQVILELTKNDGSNQAKLQPVIPVVSNIIYDKKIGGDLLITDISDNTSPAAGGKKIMIFCERVSQEDIKLRFFKEKADKTVEWEAWGQFTPRNVHRHLGISFRTPAYSTQDIIEPVDVCLQLFRPSDGEKSRPLNFRYVPDYANINRSMKNKKRKMAESEELYQYIKGLEVEQRNNNKIERNINPDIIPNIGPNQIHTGTATVEPQPQAPIIESNFISNLSCNGQLVNNPEQGGQFQQTHGHNHRPTHGSNTQRNCYSNQPQPQQSQVYFSQAQTNQLPHNRFQSQSKYIHTELHPSSHLPMRLADDKPDNVPLDFEQQSQINSSYYNQQQQFLPPSNFYEMYPNPGCGGTNTSSSTPYQPFSNYHTGAAAMYDSTSQKVNQCSLNKTPTQDPTMMIHHQQNLCDNNLKPEELTGNMNDDLDTLLLGTLW